MATSHFGNTNATSYTTPPPSSLCPQCQQVEVDARQHRNGSHDLIVYVCDQGHEWVTRWAVAA